MHPRSCPRSHQKNNRNADVGPRLSSFSSDDPWLDPSSVVDYCGGWIKPWSRLCLRRNPPKRVLLRQGFGGHPLRIPPQLDGCGFIRRWVKKTAHLTEGLAERQSLVHCCCFVDSPWRLCYPPVKDEWLVVTVSHYGSITYFCRRQVFCCSQDRTDNDVED